MSIFALLIIPGIIQLFVLILYAYIYILEKTKKHGK
jgi:hypothetical protein